PSAAPSAAQASNDDEEDLFGLDDDTPAASSADDDDDLFGMDDDVDAAANSGDDEVTEDELAALLGSIDTEKKESTTGTTDSASAAEKPKESPPPSTGELITDDEFEALLDDLHGKAAGPTAAPSGAAATQGSAPTPADDSNSGLITDNEFDALLDELYGKGAGPTVAKAGAAPAEPAPSAPAAPKAPAPAPAAKAAVNQAPSAPVAAEKPKAPAAAKKASGKEPTPAAAETTVRVDTKRLDDIMNMVGELVLVRNRLVRLGLASSDEHIQKAVANLDVVTADIQMSVMKTRMQPIKKVFGRFPRVVRDLARNLKKEINLELEGEDTDLDKNLVEALSDPLVHLVRNSVDHGIEMPSEREAAGKPRIGKILLSAEQEGDHIILSIRDDGGGMDPDMLRSKAVEKGMMDEEAAERLTDEEAFNLIFHPGFSTKAEISDVSGRGVGMDVVKTKISQLNGSITIHSELDVGTLIAIKVPLTLAIMPTLMVKLGDQAFALPLVSVNEIFHLDLDRANVLDGQEVVIVRDKAVPLFYLKRWLVPGHKGDLVLDSAHVVVVTVGTTKVGLVVDQLIGQEEVVIKPLGKMLHGTPGMSGATITGDGSIAIILDVPSLIKQYT
ncbi:MAG: chemotaxis protein CheA, partial [Gammaproteobacteria bacterium]|nr:chemotaxis protein CheA [Gammaproteobacteria bacterium]